VLLESILADAPSRGIETLSLVTSPPWSERWHPDTMPVWQINHYNDSIAGKSMHKIEQLKQAAKIRIKRAT